jgi:hypothetical protein
MPKIQRQDIPRALLAHLLHRIADRGIDAEALKSLAKAFLTPSQVPVGRDL